MSEANKFMEPYAVGDRIATLTPEQFIALIDGVCTRLEAAELPFHGGVNAANVSPAVKTQTAKFPLKTQTHPPKLKAEKAKMLPPKTSHPMKLLPKKAPPKMKAKTSLQTPHLWAKSRKPAGAQCWLTSGVICRKVMCRKCAKSATTV